MKKAAKKTKGTEKKKAAKKGKGTARVKKTKKVDFVEVRAEIANLVGGSASFIATKVIEVARMGQLAPAKYLFEAVGLYPATAQTESPPEDSLAFMLLKKMGLPTDPVEANQETEARAPMLVQMEGLKIEHAMAETSSGNAEAENDQEAEPQRD